MELTQLLKPWLNQDVTNCDLNDIKNDSRLIQKGDLFIAYPGAASDGRLYIEKAVQSGAVAVVYDPDNVPASFKLPVSVPCVPVPHLAEKLAQIAKRFYQEPGKSLTVTGVTGTNGKTTIAYQLAQAHDLLGQKSAYIGTIGQGNVQLLKPLDNTTPDALCLQKLLSQYQKQGVKQVCMEVSSHALSQHRVDSIDFNQALFTNLTLDHLDYHHTMQAYGEAKAMLFTREELQWAIINQDDEYQHLISRSIKPHVKIITYGMGPSCDVKAVTWHSDLNGTEIEVHSPWGIHQLNIKALGQFNIYNSLAVFSSLMISGYAADTVIQVMSRLKAAPGRMEIVANSPYVLVDYAHTPDALENVLMTLNELKKGHLWVIFGCGGDRDKTKRPVMGKAASRYADKIVITSDNPRSEDPSLIVDEIAQGIPSSTPVTKLINREEAIAHALKGAEKDDIILIAGKGHEAYQQIGSEKLAFSDQEVVRRLIKE
ncbi:UDP-N-acetylmuramoyl-L-alanyl-D-glutamate--2,6-diaminopimelate ligase [Legionella bononiensis]|uniref:UDP-N-acetylmuramoyl-L-alanyl-D-glutamate--2,6-diaminopimelate ligase n=1 Tax=Legionella bononiensis TaxID=2793102 RepID=A0ABS1W8E7_9GAMM|nr:UDP-N-acetylmuramoyl-L-alanyl-D-glutamate--2,6-diaminopimelate ligase [Legionella bononiensis]MBL7479848.1 UDP-N-acetylmuramoyl-L-alanyl-D-glutamate--2,6-diaminopimelate ligase [Legionella bononiensis]MBL7525637.1 UDP-N-acetylmuramoyl-L-alanyl-D-glutamate--2,6-diaminopimelate ligase [Legionella bononiensis]MBL7561820.1 UDP-N-acetylmuramoyl-L-alanyl-D-glutamate--2,6-diaminopimelate ligase [Legionella bononiensis]